MKLCIPEIGQQLWPVGLQISALLRLGRTPVEIGGAVARAGERPNIVTVRRSFRDARRSMQRRA